MSNSVQLRLASLRESMKEKGIDAYIVPSTDPHLSEYPAPHWAAREWISGFTGSAGTIVVTLYKAALWTDSRYFIQATDQLKNSSILLQKEDLPGTPSINEWLFEELQQGNSVGIDGNVYAARNAKNLEKAIFGKGLKLVSKYDLFDTVWKDRPALPLNQIFSLPEKYTGESSRSKTERICQQVNKVGAQGLLVASLDTIAWIFNIRGNDVEYNPVAVCYAYISSKETVLFIEPKKLNGDTIAYLKSEGITIAEYAKVYDYVSKLTSSTCLDSNKTSLSLYNAIPSECKVVDMPLCADLMKSCKNATEIEGFRNALQRDGVALVRFFMWLEKTVPQGGVTEIHISDKLIEYRSQQDLYVGESFGTIAGYAQNGAIVHYHAMPETALTLKSEGLVLIDSGAQYFDGTTDLTRTYALGALSEQMKKDYTLVLKGHIGLATAIFPQGTRGSQLDILARKALWDNGLNYLHGTGHGIGHFLNVHEGPQSIRMNENSTTLQIGMVTSNEPGMYRANEYGIRIENLILTQHKTTNEFGDFYSFETLSLCPIDTTPIAMELITAQEKLWLNEYHKIVYDRLSPSLNEEEKQWLKHKTNEI